ncbi:hypothetical protein D3C76_1147990 [compost metagenome]
MDVIVPSCLFTTISVLLILVSISGTYDKSITELIIAGADISLFNPTGDFHKLLNTTVSYPFIFILSPSFNVGIPCIFISYGVYPNPFTLLNKLVISCSLFS